MAVTKSNKSNITSPNGNSLALFVDINDDKLKMKDINGVVQPLDDFVSVVANFDGSPLVNFSANLQTLAANTIFDASNTATFNGSVTKVSGARTFTFDNALPLGFTMTIIQTDANQTTFVGAGSVVINNRQSQNKNNGQYSVVSIVKIDNNSFVLGGDTSI